MPTMKLFSILRLVLIVTELLRANLNVVIPNHVTVRASASLGVASGLASGGGVLLPPRHNVDPITGTSL